MSSLYAITVNLDSSRLLTFDATQFSFSLVALALSAARLQRLDDHAGSTLNYTPWDRVNGKPYELPGLVGLPLGQIARYEKILTEVLVSSLFTTLWALYAYVIPHASLKSRCSPSLVDYTQWCSVAGGRRCTFLQSLLSSVLSSSHGSSCFSVLS